MQLRLNKHYQALMKFVAMAQVKIFYEPEMELLTVFWQSPRKSQIATELGDGVILLKADHTGDPIGLEIMTAALIASLLKWVKLLVSNQLNSQKSLWHHDRPTHKNIQLLTKVIHSFCIKWQIAELS